MHPSLSVSMAIALAGALAAPALAGVEPPPGTGILAGSLTADNLFDAYISTSPTVAGTLWLSGNSWPTTYQNQINITAPGTYYLHVRAQDQGRPEMFIGRFTLAGADATFANGSHELLTNTTDWVVSTTGFGLNTTAPLFVGDNGAGPWGNFTAMGANADFIWAPEYANGIAYFTASFTIVPTPGAAMLLGAGTGLIHSARRRRA